jgi:hypothetical protein
MRSGGSKQKGNQMENLIARKLSLWITNGKREDVLIRSQNSGGRATVLSYTGKNFVSQAGDIVSAAFEGNKFTNMFYIEVKHYQNLNLESLIFRTSKSGIIEHWNKLLKECEFYNKLPLYIARQNNKPILVGLSKNGIDIFELHHDVEIHILYLDLYLLPLTTFLSKANVKKVQNQPEYIFKKRQRASC